MWNHLHGSSLCCHMFPSSPGNISTRWSVTGVLPPALNSEGGSPATGFQIKTVNSFDMRRHRYLSIERLGRIVCRPGHNWNGKIWSWADTRLQVGKQAGEGPKWPVQCTWDVGKGDVTEGDMCCCMWGGRKLKLAEGKMNWGELTLASRWTYDWKWWGMWRLYQPSDRCPIRDHVLQTTSCSYKNIWSLCLWLLSKYFTFAVNTDLFK